MQNHHFNILAKKIVEVFPKEDERIYYIPPKTDGPQQLLSRGKLPDKYRNWITAQKKIGFSREKETDEQCDDGEQATNIALLDEERYKNEAVQWLLNNFEPWDSVVKNFQKCQEFRLRDFQSAPGNIQSIFERWPVLMQPRGLELIDSDFTFQFGREGQIFVEWRQFAFNIFNLMQTEVKDKTALSLLSTLKLANIPDETRNLKLLMLLPSLIPSSCRLRSLKRPYTYWKPSIQNSLDTFILHEKIQGNIENTIRDLKEKHRLYNLTFQPLIIVVGPNLDTINAIYVYIDSSVYKVTSILKAVDLCYKAFHIFHAHYPVICQQVWLLIQKGIYKQNTAWDKTIAGVNTILRCIQDVQEI
ncbi:uncharacterized protein LOC122508962 isoform X2 [Leptopilina heterotoma]|uniref:uncharacterized protein LOC122508962 isoform X2 n=1 Tax=Leptopilina heterotoma TaxID=63436 RepID=UPI001CA89D6B|nr:uncharacterized protein LOC122508962 isoform X2 [Leptopilina heterotoma]